MYSAFLRASPVQSIPRKSVNNQFFCCLLDQSLSPYEFREIHKQNPGDFHGSPFVSVLLRSGNALQESVLCQAKIEGLSRFRAPTVIYHMMDPGIHHGFIRPSLFDTAKNGEFFHPHV